MATQLARSIQAEIRQMDGNMQCVECSAASPQWASVSYGTLFCLKCSGQHRSLGVHLSFVRSMQMDSWTDKQIQTLRVGGNKNMKAFFEQYQVPKTLSIKEKYNTVQAEAYRERIVALRDGKPPPCTTVPVYKPPAPRADGLSEDEAARKTMRRRLSEDDAARKAMRRRLKEEEAARKRMSRRLSDEDAARKRVRQPCDLQPSREWVQKWVQEQLTNFYTKSVKCLCVVNCLAVCVRACVRACVYVCCVSCACVLCIVRMLCVCVCVCGCSYACHQSH